MTPSESFSKRNSLQSSEDAMWLDTRNRQNILGLIRRQCNVAFVAVGCLEPPLPLGMTRLRWKCVSRVPGNPSSLVLVADSFQRCGDTLYDDVTEYREGGTTRLVERLQQSSSSKVTATSYSEDTANQQYAGWLMNWVRAVTRKITNVLEQDREFCDDSTQQAGSDTITRSDAVSIEMPPLRRLLLLACMHKLQGGKGLLQESIETIENDRHSFNFIRSQLRGVRGRPRAFFQSKVVTGIHFTKVSQLAGSKEHGG